MRRLYVAVLAGSVALATACDDPETAWDPGRPDASIASPDAGAGGPDASEADAGPPPPPPEGPAIVVPVQASYYEQLGARELRRYFYQRTGMLLPVVASDTAIGGEPPVIAVARRDRALAGAYATAAASGALAELGPSEILLTTAGSRAATIYLAAGGDDVGTLQAAYRLAAHLGVRFYLDGDVIPDATLALDALPQVEERSRPRFATRGILPFHDFPEGPDWWNTDDYLAVVGQLAKLGMSFLGLHTYSEGGPNAEPTVWIGQPSDLEADGRVRFGYPASYYTTVRDTWGYRPLSVDGYRLGMSALYDHDGYGADVMRGFAPEPVTSWDASEVFDRTGAMLRTAFAQARRLGVKTCVGTETPLVVPTAVGQRLGIGASGPGPADVARLYEGIFTRAGLSYPLDYYWLWTSEGWTWNTPTPEDIQRTLDDLQLAVGAAQRVAAPFRVATSGWVVGPPGDRTAFARLLPSGSPISAIHRQVGQVPIDPAFSQVTDRPKWAVPWMEDDPNILSPQLWAARARRDVQDAWVYGCSGIIGLHWRTREIGPTVAMLAEASWVRQPGLAPAPQADLSTIPAVRDFYVDWAGAQFGASVAVEAGEIFASIDSRLPQPTTWVDGPGSLRPVMWGCPPYPSPYGFIDAFAALRDRVQGPGNLARFDAWLASFRRMATMDDIQCTWTAYEEALERARAASPDQAMVIARGVALPLRQRIVAGVAEAQAGLVATLSSPGTLGTITNWQQHVMPGMPIGPDAELEALLGGPLPADAMVGNAYPGAPRLTMLTVRTARQAGEPLRIRALLMPAGGGEVMVHARAMGSGAYVGTALRPVAGATWEGELPAAEPGVDLEYYLEARLSGGQVLRFPPTAPELNLTVITEPAGAPAAAPGLGEAELAPAFYPSAPPVAIRRMSVAPDSLLADKVMASDWTLGSDGGPDGSFDVEIDGRFRALVLQKVDAAGVPTGEQWDTIFRFDPMPAGLGTPYLEGTETWQLGVTMNGKLINFSNGEVSLEGPGPHVLRVYATNPPWIAFRPQAKFRLIVVRLDRSVEIGPTVTY